MNFSEKFSPPHKKIKPGVPLNSGEKRILELRAYVKELKALYHSIRDQKSYNFARYVHFIRPYGDLPVGALGGPSLEPNSVEIYYMGKEMKSVIRELNDVYFEIAVLQNPGARRESFMVKKYRSAMNGVLEKHWTCQGTLFGNWEEKSEQNRKRKFVSCLAIKK